MSEFIHTYCERHDGPSADIEGEVFTTPISIRKSRVIYWEGVIGNPDKTLIYVGVGDGDCAYFSIDMEYRDFTRAMGEE